MSEISDKIKEYNDEDLSLDELADWLARFPYVSRRGFFSDSQLAELSEEDDAWADVDGTWDEIIVAFEHYLLTQDEYDTILTRHDEYEQATGQRAGYREPT